MSKKLLIDIKKFKDKNVKYITICNDNIYYMFNLNSDKFFILEALKNKYHKRVTRLEISMDYISLLDPELLRTLKQYLENIKDKDYISYDRIAFEVE